MKNLYMTIVGNFMNITNLSEHESFELDFNNKDLYLTYEEVYVGIPAKQLLEKVPVNEAENIINDCIAFYCEFCTQLRDRFDFKNSISKLLNVLNPQAILKKEAKSIQDLVTLFPNLLLPDDVQNIDNEFRQLRFINFDNHFNKDEQNSIPVEVFWKKISEIDQGSSKAFPTLSTFVEHLFCLPHSSANVERIFSSINANKTKKRNKLGSDMLSALLYTKSLLKNEKFKCFDFEPNEKMYKLFTTAMYTFN